MEAIFFESSIVAMTKRRTVLVALFDGSIEGDMPQACVAILECRSETADALGSALKALQDPADGAA